MVCNFPPRRYYIFFIPTEVGTYNFLWDYEWNFSLVGFSNFLIETGDIWGLYWCFNSLMFFSKFSELGELYLLYFFSVIITLVSFSCLIHFNRDFNLIWHMSCNCRQPCPILDFNRDGFKISPLNTICYTSDKDHFLVHFTKFGAYWFFPRNFFFFFLLSQ